ncbi:MAG TPA: enoyl-CoA hydratase, partial [Caulobacter sp.]|nr:enoyl-CoA hydratase [Caulobacter sp.]
MSLILTEKRGHVAILTLNRPDAMNALGAPGDG